MNLLRWRWWTLPEPTDHKQRKWSTRNRFSPFSNPNQKLTNPFWQSAVWWNRRPTLLSSKMIDTFTGGNLGNWFFWPAIIASVVMGGFVGFFCISLIFPKPSISIVDSFTVIDFLRNVFSFSTFFFFSRHNRLCSTESFHTKCNAINRNPLNGDQPPANGRKPIVNRNSPYYSIITGKSQLSTEQLNRNAGFFGIKHHRIEHCGKY